MVESLLFLTELVVVTYASWVVVQLSRKDKPSASDLKLFAFKTREDEDQT